jgi:hypothetical protein
MSKESPNKEKPRTLTKDDKRRIEKLIFQEIDKAQNEMDDIHQRAKEALIAKLNANIPKDIQEMFEAKKAAEAKSKKLEKAIEERGYRIANAYGEKAHVEVYHYGEGIAPELDAFGKESDAKKLRIEALRKEYTLKLFGGESKALEIFEELEKELKELVS